MIWGSQEYPLLVAVESLGSLNPFEVILNGPHFTVKCGEQSV